MEINIEANIGALFLTNSLMILVVFCLSCLTWFLIEKPFMELRVRYISSPPNLEDIDRCHVKTYGEKRPRQAGMNISP